jgi:acyl-CoA thioester hydrolase
VPSPSPAPLGRFPVTIELPVQWGDMDALGHVNNVVYLRWFESARIAYFDRSGLWDRFERGVGPILARSTIDYKIPLDYPDTVRVSCSISRFGTSSLTLQQRLRSQRRGAVAAEGEAVLVLVNYKTGEKVPIWDELRSQILALEASGPGPGDA